MTRASSECAAYEQRQKQRKYTDTPTFTPTVTDTLTFTPTATDTPTVTPTFTPTPTQIPSGPVTINYVYDPLYRLTEANYSNGDYYHYAYDSVGNRLAQDHMLNGQSSVVNYTYDNANRIASAGGVTYTFDNNGNLLSHGRKITFRICSMLEKQVEHDQVYRRTASHENNQEEIHTSKPLS